MYPEVVFLLDAEIQRIADALPKYTVLFDIAVVLETRMACCQVVRGSWDLGISHIFQERLELIETSITLPVDKPAYWDQPYFIS